MPERPWIVTPHEPIAVHEDNLWSVASDVPRMKGMNRRMAIARLRDGRLVFFNGVPVDDPSLERIRAWGRPWLLLLPHHSHMLDAHPFAQKLGLTSCCPDAELEPVRRRLPDAVPLFSIQLDDTVRAGTLQGTRLNEAFLLVRSKDRASLALSDVVMNLQSRRLLFRLLGFSGGPKQVPFQRWFFMKDARRLREELEQLAHEPGLERLLPSHGAVTDRDGARHLARIAEGL